MERLQDEVDVLRQHKAKEAANVQALQQALKDAKKEFADFKAAREEEESMHADVNDNLESLMLGAYCTWPCRPSDTLFRQGDGRSACRRAAGAGHRASGAR